MLLTPTWSTAAGWKERTGQERTEEEVVGQDVK